MNGLLEKTIANWLDNCSERSYQVPFCFLLLADGHKLLHSTRHGPLELGKDIISVDPQGTICAFQLKGNAGKNFTLSDWRNINSQIQDLVIADVAHPSKKKQRTHRSFLVTNGFIDEEVWRVVSDVNKTFKRRYKRTLEVWHRGDLIDMANRAGVALWPSELSDTSTFLQLFVHNGKDPLDKDKFTSFFESLFQLGPEGKKPTVRLAKRKIYSSALICALALTPFVKTRNHFGIIEGWAIFMATALCFVNRWGLDKKHFWPSIDLAKEAIFSAIKDLIQEAQQRKNLHEGEWIVDKLAGFDSVRAQYLCAYGSILGLHQHLTQTSYLDGKELQDFSLQCFSKGQLWGESSIPLCLIFYWYWRTFGSQEEAQQYVANLFKKVCECNQPQSKMPLVSPYYGIEEIIRCQMSPESDLAQYTFTGASFTLEGLLLLLVKAEMKEIVKQFWPIVTKITFRSFEPEEKWQYLLWHSERGTNINQVPRVPTSWDQLKERLSRGERWCSDLFYEDPVLWALFLLVYNHRITASACLWLDSAFSKKN